MPFLSQQNILLSISILISNRPDTVGKCLRSLDSLRRKVPSELILVDTGCGEAVRKMIEAYGDRIVEFEWCNDFAKARNAGLELAKGQWFLYLDDDEWFENTDELEDFFLSGKHLHYNYASYLVRNYFDPEGKRYRDEYVGRMVRLEPDTKFVNSIHETFSKARQPWIRLHSYVHHYGYAFKNEEEARKHGQRNIAMLLAEHEKEPGELRHVAHLVQEYNALKEWENSIAISVEGIQNAEPGISMEQFLGGLYVNIVRNHVVLGQYANAVETGEKYLELDCSNELDRAAVCYNLCIAYLETADYAKSLEAAERYLDFYEKWKGNRDATALYEYLAVAFMSEGCKQAALCMAVQDGITLGKVALAKKHFDEIDWKIIHSMLETQGVQGMVQALVRESFCTDTGAMQDYIAMVKALLEDSALAEMAAKEIYRIPLYRWERAVKIAIQELEWQDVQQIQACLQETLDGNSFHMLHWSTFYRMRRIYGMVTEKEGEEKAEDQTDAFQECMVQELLAYAAENEKLYRGLYREEVFQEMPELLPRECQVSLKLLDMRKAMEEKDFQRGVSDMRDALEVMPEFSDILKYCSKWISERAAAWELEQKQVSLEMRKLAEAVKDKVRSLAAQGMLTEAAAFLRQLKTLVPEDEEAEKMEQEIVRQMAETQYESK